MLSVLPSFCRGYLVGKTYPERSAIWDANGQVRKYGQQAVRHRALESKIVRNLMDCQKQVLVRSRPNDIGEAPVLQTPERRVLEVQGAGHLERDDGEDDPFREGLVAAELRDLGVRLDDGDATRAVGFLGIGPKEVVVRGGGGSIGGLGLLGRGGGGRLAEFGRLGDGCRRCGRHGGGFEGVNGRRPIGKARK